MMIYALLSTVNMGLSPLLRISYHSLVSSHPPTLSLYTLLSSRFLHMIPLRAFSTIPVSSTPALDSLAQLSTIIFLTLLSSLSPYSLILYCRRILIGTTYIHLRCFLCQLAYLPSPLWQ